MSPENPCPVVFEGEDFSYQTFRLSQESIESEESEKNDGRNEGGEFDERKKKQISESKQTPRSKESEKKRELDESQKTEDDVNEFEDENGTGDGNDKQHKKKRLKKLTGDLIGKMAEIIVLQNETCDE